MTGGEDLAGVAGSGESGYPKTRDRYQSKEDRFGRSLGLGKRRCGRAHVIYRVKARCGRTARGPVPRLSVGFEFDSMRKMVMPVSFTVAQACSLH